MCAVVALHHDVTKLALSLLDIFFPKEELGKSLVTPMNGRELLDPHIVDHGPVTSFHRCLPVTGVATSVVCVCVCVCVCGGGGG